MTGSFKTLERGGEEFNCVTLNVSTLPSRRNPCAFLRVTFSYWIDSSCPLFQLHYKVLVLKKLIDLTKGERNDDNNGHWTFPWPYP